MIPKGQMTKLLSGIVNGLDGNKAEHFLLETQLSQSNPDQKSFQMLL